MAGAGKGMPGLLLIGGMRMKRNGPEGLAGEASMMTVVNSGVIAAGSDVIVTGLPVSDELVARFVAYIDRSPKTARTYLVNLRQFVAWLWYAGIEQPGRADVMAFRDWLSSEHDAIEWRAEAPGWRYRLDGNGNRMRITCKPTTVKQYLQSVKQFSAWAVSSGLLAVDIGRGIHGPKVVAMHRKDSLAAADVRTIEDSIDRSNEQGKRLYAMFTLAVNAGLRTVELSRANIRDVELKNGAAFLYVWGKGHAEPDTKKPLAPEVYAALQDYISARTDTHTASSPLFVATGNRSGGQRLAPTTISVMLKKAMQAAGYDSDRLTAHSLRHTAGQNVMEITGHNLYKTQQYMRHSNPATTEVYLDNDSTQQDAEIARQLYAHYHGQQTDGPAERLAAAAQRLTPEQLEQLANLAMAMGG